MSLLSEPPINNPPSRKLQTFSSRLDTKWKILGSLNNNCDKQQKELENAALVIHTKHQHFGLYIIKETSHFSKYCNSQYIEACLYVGIGMQFRKEKKNKTKQNHTGASQFL